ncbi:MAG: site-2 protease family protein [Patescibacteria group bacterium]
MLISVIAILAAISIHEFAHAWAADYLGDPTPKLEGRLTLNPFAHLDPIGTAALFLLGFGWGKPVPIDPYNLRQPKRDQGLIALSGPLSNIICAILVGVLLKLVPVQLPAITLELFHRFLMISLGLAFFNLIPLNPLDGSKILTGLLPFEQSEVVEDFLKVSSLPILLGLLLPIFNGNSLISLLLFPLLNLCLSLLT